MVDDKLDVDPAAVILIAKAGIWSATTYSDELTEMQCLQLEALTQMSEVIAAVEASLSRFHGSPLSTAGRVPVIPVVLCFICRHGS